MRITLPKGFEPPVSAKPGEPFEAVATLLMNEDGTFELSALDGMDVGELNEPEPDMNMPWNQGDPFAETEETLL